MGRLTLPIFPALSCTVIAMIVENVTSTVVAMDVDAESVVFPAYCAVIDCDPIGRVLVVKLAVPLAS